MYVCSYIYDAQLVNSWTCETICEGGMKYRREKLKKIAFGFWVDGAHIDLNMLKGGNFYGRVDSINKYNRRYCCQWQILECKIDIGILLR